MQCGICLQKFNAIDRAPQDVCSNKHTYCKKCVNIILEDDARCPHCRQQIKKQLVCTNRAAVAIIQEISHEQVSDNKISPPSDATAIDPPLEILTVKYFFAKFSICVIIGWLNLICLWLYLKGLGHYYQLGMLYFAVFKFYQVARNIQNIEFSSKKMLIKLVLFGLLDEIDNRDRMFYIQFILRWLASVLGIVMIQTYQIGQWNSVAIIALASSLLSVAQIIVSRKYVQQILDKTEESSIMCVPITALVFSILFSLVTCLSSFFHMMIVWPPLIALYFLLWIIVAIYSSVGKHKNTCFGLFVSVLILVLALPFSVGMFFWMACKHGLNRWPSYIMLVIRYLVCPLLHIVMISVFPQGPSQDAFVTMQVLSAVQIGLALYLLTRTTQ